MTDDTPQAEPPHETSISDLQSALRLAREENEALRTSLRMHQAMLESFRRDEKRQRALDIIRRATIELQRLD
jgi:hypothetical protein